MSVLARTPRRIDQEVVRRAGLTGLVRPASEHSRGVLTTERALPVLPELRALLPGAGLRRGSTIAVATPVPDTPTGRLTSSSATLVSAMPPPGLRSTDAVVTALGRGAPAGGRGDGRRLSTSEKSAARWGLHNSDAREQDRWDASNHSQRRSGRQLSLVGDTGTGRRGPDSDYPAAQYGVGTSASSSVLLALLAAASASGSWCGVVGMPALNLVAASEMGVVLDRLVLVPSPGVEWAGVVGALLDGLDIVVAAPPGPIAPTIASRLAARARQRGSVLIPYGRLAGADVTVEATRSVWEGLGAGHGRLRCRELTVRSYGRGAASVPREVRFRIGGGPVSQAPVSQASRPSVEVPEIALTG